MAALTKQSVVNGTLGSQYPVAVYRRADGTEIQAVSIVDSDGNPSPASGGYGSAGAYTAPTITTSSSTIAAASTTRVGLTLTQLTGVDMYVAYGFPATTSNYSVILKSGDYLEVPSYAVRLQINGCLSAGSTTVKVTSIT